MSGCERFAQWDAAYLLGALDPTEAAEYERHIAGCPDCARELERARQTVGLLGALPAEAFREPAAPIPDTLLPALARQARRATRRRRGLVVGLAAAVAASLIALAIAVWPGGSSAHRPPAQALAAQLATPLQASARLEALSWGTRIDLVCTYRTSGYPASAAAYRLVVVDTAGHRSDLGSWTVRPEATTRYSSGTSLPLPQIAQVQIALPNGTIVLALRR